MKKSHVVRLAILLMIASTLSGCLWVVEDEGYYGGGGGHHDRGEHRGERH